eukprot:TRINITY_DN12653_c0_g1_i1.p1 TRINITY_DN12653_c0_g1~~TRINITY_DN12653_c0_g1_i1.p1  ORF type:complete len:326 (+),score=70.33 TRINITY_DN12653_c0_g1_i1:53-979(+)
MFANLPSATRPTRITQPVHSRPLLLSSQYRRASCRSYTQFTKRPNPGNADLHIEKPYVQKTNEIPEVEEFLRKKATIGMDAGFIERLWKHENLRRRLMGDDPLPKLQMGLNGESGILNYMLNRWKSDVLWMDPDHLFCYAYEHHKPEDLTAISPEELAALLSELPDDVEYDESEEEFDAVEELMDESQNDERVELNELDSVKENELGDLESTEGSKLADAEPTTEAEFLMVRDDAGEMNLSLDMKELEKQFEELDELDFTTEDLVVPKPNPYFPKTQTLRLIESDKQNEKKTVYDERDPIPKNPTYHV